MRELPPYAPMCLVLLTFVKITLVQVIRSAAMKKLQVVDLQRLTDTEILRLFLAQNNITQNVNTP
jgi:hypothetical protein